MGPTLQSRWNACATEAETLSSFVTTLSRLLLVTSTSQPRSLQRSGHQQADGRPALSPDWPCTAGAADPTHIYPYRSVSCSAVAPLQRRGSIAAMELRHLNLDRFEEVPFYPCAKWGVVSRLFIQNGAKRLKNGAFQGYTVSLIDRTGIFGNDVGTR